MEVKKAGEYKTKLGRKVFIYGFDDLATGETMYAEGYFVENKNMCWWSPETGERSFSREDDSDDIVERIGD